VNTPLSNIEVLLFSTPQKSPIAEVILKPLTISFSMLFLALLLAGCGTTSLQSHRLNTEIKIDGDLSDWPILTQKQAGQNILVRTMEDGKYFYISLLVHDPQYTRSIIAGGLKTWLDPQGGQNKSFGILFPVGMADLHFRRKDVDHKMRDPQALDDLLKVMTEDLKTIDEKGQVHCWTVEDLHDLGFEAEASLSNGTFICEMKMPMDSQKSLGIAFAPEKKNVIGLGLEAVGMGEDPKVEFASRTQWGEEGPPGNMNPGGGMGPRGGMDHRGMGPKSAGRSTTHSENIAGFKKLKTWMKIVLSK
jgi:hypothetical protein